MSFDYVYRTNPYPYQRDIVENSSEKEYLSLFNDPGTGKTKIMIDQFSYLYQQGKIDAVLVIAPNGVHLNWVAEEMPKHTPLDVLEKAKCVVYHSSKAKTKKAEYKREELLKYTGGLCVIVAAYEAATTETFKAYMKRFFAKKRTMLILDESHRIKKRDGKRKSTIVAMGGHAKYRRILTGSPVELPPDIYSQVRFLSPTFWRDRGLGTAAEFDAKFCVQRAMSFGGRSFKQTVGYQNLDILQKYVAETGYRITMEMAGIHLPPTIYSKRHYEMFPEQRRMYEELEKTFRTEFEDGVEIDGEAAITRLLRLQQIICGYCGTVPGEPIKRISEKENPRLELCLDILEDLPHSVIIWARFQEDISQLCKALGKDAVRYDGSVDNDERARAKKAFQAGDVKYMVMSEAGAEGLTLTTGKSCIFYSCGFSMTKRVQQEARNVRIGQNVSTNCIDLVCQGTVDEKIIDALRTKRDIASQLTGDELKSWI